MIFGALVRRAAALAVSVAVSELKKPETQAKIGRALADAQQRVSDPEQRANAARMLGRVAGTLRNKLKD